MDSERVQVKVFAKAETAAPAEALIPVFHRWIRDDVLDELVIDVADYSHVHHGPGVLLVGHGGDYGYDFADGRPGLLYHLKRDHEGPFEARLEAALRRALGACRHIEEEPELEGALSFDTHEVQIRIPDRLNAPPTEATWQALRASIETVLGRLFAGTAFRARPVFDGRRPLTVHVTSDGSADVATLLERLA